MGEPVPPGLAHARVPTQEERFASRYLLVPIPRRRPAGVQRRRLGQGCDLYRRDGALGVVAGSDAGITDNGDVRRCGERSGTRQSNRFA